jgi:dGTPase
MALPKVSIRREDRIHADPTESRSQRTPFQRDRDRILYSSAFRRLALITQVVSPQESALVHNRLTHVLKVAQVGRRLAERLIRETEPDVIKALGGLDADVVETACLAHDLGHPPFGHIAEYELDRLARDADAMDGFEGNAQSFRIVTKIERRNNQESGLNLTRASLAAILKYPWMRETDGPRRNKWGAYRSELDDFTFARRKLKKYKKSLEAELMDWADDIAYSVHDVEDFYLLGKIPLGRLSRDQDEQKSFLKYALEKLKPSSDQRGVYEKAAAVLFSSLPVSEAFHGEPFYAIAVRSFGSQSIGQFISATSLTRNGLQIDGNMRARVDLMKQLVWRYVIDDESLAGQQQGQKRIIRSLFEIFYEGDSKLFPPSLKDRAGETSPKTPERARVVLDLISGFTEHEAVQTFHRFTGIRLGSLFSINTP